MTHPLAEAVVHRAKSRQTPPMEVIFNLRFFGEGRVAALEPFVGESGQLAVSLLTIDSLNETEEHLILAAESDSGVELDSETIGRLLVSPRASAAALHFLSPCRSKQSRPGDRQTSRLRSRIETWPFSNQKATSSTAGR